jgi:type IV secretory pathway VirB10-like protein
MKTVSSIIALLLSAPIYAQTIGQPQPQQVQVLQNDVLEPPVVEEQTFVVPIGAIAAGSLNITSSSDYPGPFRATLAHPIYTVDKKLVLFPAGSWVTGLTQRSEGVNEAIHNRITYLPRFITRPDGRSFPLEGAFVLDKNGIGAIKDQVDYHIDVQAAALAATTGLNVLPEIIQDAISGNAASVTAGTFIDGARNRGEQIINRYLELVPTATVRAGKEMLIFFGDEAKYPMWEPRNNIRFTNVTLEDIENE